MRGLKGIAARVYDDATLCGKSKRLADHIKVLKEARCIGG